MNNAVCKFFMPFVFNSSFPKQIETEKPERRINNLQENLAHRVNRKEGCSTLGESPRRIEIRRRQTPETDGRALHDRLSGAEYKSSEMHLEQRFSID
jgi:hypothetical protein